MATTNPNPPTNPGMELICNNCTHMTPDKSTGLTEADVRGKTWIWNTPYGTYVGAFDESPSDPTKVNEINMMHPHCPICGSHSVSVVRTL